jgi:hypothetical protein
MSSRQPARTLRVMTTTYAVAWQDGGGRLRSGKAELGSRELQLQGSGERVAVRYDELAGVSIAHTAEERIGGRPTLVLERTGDDPLRLASVAQIGIVAELAERLTSLQLGRLAARNQLLVVLPLREGAREEAQRLLDVGPPFDLGAAGLRRHRVFLSDREAIFLFETDGAAAGDDLLDDADVLAAATAWEELAAGPARMGDVAFSWTRDDAA